MAKDGNTLYLEILNEISTNSDFYRSGEISERLRLMNIDPGNIANIIPNSHQHDAPTKTSTSYVLDLISGDHRRPLISLYAQFYYTGMIQSNTPGVPLRHEKRKANLVYRKEQLDFLNRLGLPVPHAFTIVNRDSGGNFATALLTEYWRYEVPHSLNLLALNYRLAQIEERMKRDHTLDHFPYTVLKNKLNEEKKLIIKIKDDMIDSTLDTINMIASIATHTLYHERGNTALDKAKISFDEDKATNAFSDVYNWYALMAGNERLSIKNHKEKIRSKFASSMDNLIEFIKDPSKTVYLQGDEFLYHFQYTKMNGKVYSGIFDFDRAGLDRLEKSKAKVLLSVLLDYDYDKQSDFVIRSNERLEDMLAYVSSDENEEVRKRLNYIKNPEKFMLYFDIAAIYETIRMAGRIAYDTLKHKEFVTKREDLLFDFDNQILKDIMGEEFYTNLPEKVPLKIFGANSSIPLLKAGLETRIYRMIEGNTPYGKVPEKSLEDLEIILGLFRGFDSRQTTFI
ncbi:MAG: hypothetical protein Q8R00_04740 [Candidatus Nanoarchaeia archaeon]|nr:hypothetical protein [Candidatus Nanoarchaeia archaeon]